MDPQETNISDDEVKKVFFDKRLGSREEIKPSDRLGLKLLIFLFLCSELDKFCNTVLYRFFLL